REQTLYARLRLSFYKQSKLFCETLSGNDKHAFLEYFKTSSSRFMYAKDLGFGFQLSSSFIRDTRNGRLGPTYEADARFLMALSSRGHTLICDDNKKIPRSLNVGGIQPFSQLVSLINPYGCVIFMRFLYRENGQAELVTAFKEVVRCYESNSEAMFEEVHVDAPSLFERAIRIATGDPNTNVSADVYHILMHFAEALPNCAKNPKSKAVLRSISDFLLKTDDPNLPVSERVNMLTQTIHQHDDGSTFIKSIAAPIRSTVELLKAGNLNRLRKPTLRADGSEIIRTGTNQLEGLWGKLNHNTDYRSGGLTAIQELNNFIRSRNIDGLRDSAGDPFFVQAQRCYDIQIVDAANALANQLHQLDGAFAFPRLPSIPENILATKYLVGPSPIGPNPSPRKRGYQQIQSRVLSEAQESEGQDDIVERVLQRVGGCNLDLPATRDELSNGLRSISPSLEVGEGLAGYWSQDSDEVAPDVDTMDCDKVPSAKRRRFDMEVSSDSDVDSRATLIYSAAVLEFKLVGSIQLTESSSVKSKSNESIASSCSQTELAQQLRAVKKFSALCSEAAQHIFWSGLGNPVKLLPYTVRHQWLVLKSRCWASIFQSCIILPAACFVLGMVPNCNRHQHPREDATQLATAKATEWNHFKATYEERIMGQSEEDLDWKGSKWAMVCGRKAMERLKDEERWKRQRSDHPPDSEEYHRNERRIGHFDVNPVAAAGVRLNKSTGLPRREQTCKRCQAIKTGADRDQPHPKLYCADGVGIKKTEIPFNLFPGLFVNDVLQDRVLRDMVGGRVHGFAISKAEMESIWIPKFIGLNYSIPNAL
ncbi:hypothetical protein HDU93_009501, partial [Gonapodya sp. JEL0774]